MNVMRFVFPLWILVTCGSLLTGTAWAQDETQTEQETVVRQEVQAQGIQGGQDTYIQITIAHKKRDWKKLSTYGSTHPSYFNCDYPDFVESLLEAYKKRNESEQYLQLATRLISTCNNNDLLRKVYNQAPFGDSQMLELFSQGINTEDMGDRSFISEIKRKYLIERMQEAIAANDLEDLKILDPTTFASLSENTDTNSAALMAWKYLDAGKNEDAIRWFEIVDDWGGLTENMREGLRLARQRHGVNQPATVAEKKPEVPEVVIEAPQDFDPNKSRAEQFKERELWDMIGEGKFAEARKEIFEFSSLMPEWRVPEKMRKILDEQAYRDAITKEEKILWKLLEKGEYRLLDEQIIRVQEQYPEWTAPEEMVRIKNERLATTSIARAIKDKDWEAFSQLHDDHPEFFNCDRIDFMWADAEFHATQKDWKEARKVYLSIISRCSDEYGLATLQKALNHMPEDQVSFLYDDVLTISKAPAILDTILNARYQLELKRLGNAIAEEDIDQAVSLSIALEDQIRKRKDTLGANLTGWVEYNREAYEQASAWFKLAQKWGGPNDESEYGLIMSQYKAGNREEAMDLIAANESPGPKAREASLLIYGTMCWDLYEEKKYEEVLEILHELKGKGPLGRDERMLEAWSLNSLGQRGEAYDIFETLYLERPDKATASGLIATTPTGSLARLERITKLKPGPLDKMLGPEIAKGLYESKRFLQTERFFPGLYRSLKNIQKPSLLQTMVFRNKKGIKGPGELSIVQIPVFSGEVIFNKAHEFRAGVSRSTIETGTLENTKPLGNFPLDPRDALNWRYQPNTSVENGISTFFQYRYHGNLSPKITIQSTPSEGVFDPVTSFDVSIAGSGILDYWEISGFSKPVRESLLSYTGMIDPYQGQTWGQVMRNGIHGLGVKEIDEWAINFTLTAASFDGENVADNEQFGTTLTLLWESKTRRLDRMAWGSRLLYETYSNNQHHFTFGHGGYFSPKEFVQMGAVLSIQTKEARNFILAGEFELGYQEHTQDAAPLFPINNIGNRFYPEEQTDSVVYLVNLRGVYRMNRSWQAGAEVLQRKTALYSDTAAALYLRFVFGRRSHLFSSDLRPQFIHNVF